MRFMLRVSVPNQPANDLIKSGKFFKTFDAILSELKPEAAYMFDVDGMRGCVLIVHMKDASELPRFAEPFFMAFEAEIDCHMVMVQKDLKKAMPAIKAAAKKYG